MEVQEKLHSLSLRYLTVRGRSRWEMQVYLEKKCDDEAAREAVLERLEEVGLIDDRAFARNWIAGRKAARPRSRRRLAQELATKRVPREVVDEVLGEVGAEDELEAILQVARKKLRLPRYRVGGRLAGYLATQGFAFGQIKEALERLGVSLR